MKTIKTPYVFLPLTLLFLFPFGALAQDSSSQSLTLEQDLAAKPRDAQQRFRVVAAAIHAAFDLRA
jgi:hypothetical protein